jgi:arsenate reductase (thioredoxin)
MPPRSKFKVLFVCVGNACRSPMAEAVARQLASDIIEPFSAGTHPLGQLAEPTKQALLANGYSLKHLSSKGLGPHAMETADIIINMSGKPLDGLFYRRNLPNSPPVAEKIKNWNIEDPYGEESATYQKILEQIESKILLLAARLRAEQRAD